MIYYAYPGIIDHKFIPANMTQEIRIQYANQIIESVANFYGLTLDQIKGKSREGDIPKACQISSYYIRQKMPILTLKTVASLYGRRYLLKNDDFDHSAIVYNINSVNGWLMVNDPLSEDVFSIKNLI